MQPRLAWSLWFQRVHRSWLAPVKLAGVEEEVGMAPVVATEVVRSGRVPG
jgi:hypothetical protein